MRIRRHAAWSRRGVVGPTKKVLELASPSVSSLQGWRKCDRGACRWDCSYDCGKQLSTRLGGPGAQQRRLQAGHRLLLVTGLVQLPTPLLRAARAAPRASTEGVSRSSDRHFDLVPSSPLSLPALEGDDALVRAYFWDDSSFCSRSSNQSSSSLV